MKKTTITELVPSNGRRSFYGKARVVEQDGTSYLVSYETVVASVSARGKVRRHWNGRTTTTGSHISSFLDQFARAPMTNDEFYALPFEKRPDIGLDFE